MAASSLHSGSVTQTAVSSSSASNASDINDDSTSTSSASESVSLLVGTVTATMANATGTSGGAAAPTMTNTVPCNGYAEFCARNYSNITYIGAHNSPFAVPNNAASNQEYNVFAQLNDGVRMLQGQTHLVDGVLHFCHTSCDLLDAGPAEQYFANITRWLEAEENKFQVITILIANGDYSAVGNYTAPIINSGLYDYVYTPPKVPMTLTDWPTLGNLILHNTRALVFMDYEANQTAVPYIMDEFSQMWETPYDPTNNSFPCVVNRPPGLADSEAKDRLYLLNANLNAPVNLLGSQILVPNTQAINVTNGLTGQGSLGVSTNGCVADWTRPPNFLLLDYYNDGTYQGSVFEVAAHANNVTYVNQSCCGLNSSVNAAGTQRGSWWTLGLGVMAVVMVLYG